MAQKERFATSTRERKAGRELSVVLDAFLEGVVVLNSDRNVDRLNEEASRILETSSEAARGKTFEYVFGSRRTLTRLVESVFVSGRAVIERGHQTERRRGGGILVLDISVSPILERDGAPIGVLVVLKDRTLQEQVEREQSAREQLNAFGRFATGIAHEVKNPLAGIRGMAELLAARSTETKAKESAELIVREVGRIAGLVDDLMVFAQGGALRPVPTNIHQILDDVVHLVSAEGSEAIRFKRRYDPSIPLFDVDADRLMQVFLNLVRNARQALGQEGTICLSTRMAMQGHLIVRQGRPTPTVVVTVADDGPGIPPELIQKVMTPLFSTRVGGTGLGLAVAQHWVSRHEGTMRLESDIGKGTRVHVALPMIRLS